MASCGARLRHDLCHQTIMWDRIEVGLQVGVHHMSEPLLDQAIDLPQRVVTPASSSRSDAPHRQRKPPAFVGRPTSPGQAALPSANPCSKIGSITSLTAC